MSGLKFKKWHKSWSPGCAIFLPLCWFPRSELVMDSAGKRCLMLLRTNSYLRKTGWICHGKRDRQATSRVIGARVGIHIFKYNDTRDWTCSETLLFYYPSFIYLLQSYLLHLHMVKWRTISEAQHQPSVTTLLQLDERTLAVGYKHLVGLVLILALPSRLALRVSSSKLVGRVSLHLELP